MRAPSRAATGYEKAASTFDQKKNALAARKRQLEPFEQPQRHAAIGRQSRRRTHPG